MDGQLVFDWVVGVSVPIGLFLARMFWGRLDRQGEDLTMHRVEVARDYARSEKLDSLEAKILARLDQIWERLDEKADKDRAH